METQMKYDFELFAGSLSFDEPRNVSIEVGSSGDLASAVWEVQTHVKEGEKTSRMLFRFGAGLRKQDGQWRFFHGLAAVATVGQSSAELVAKMKAGKK